MIPKYCAITWALIDWLRANIKLPGHPFVHVAGLTIDKQRFRRLLLWRRRVVSPVAYAHRVRVTAVARVAGYLLISHREDAGAGKI